MARQLIAASCLGLIPSQVDAKTERELADEARRGWALFECVILSKEQGYGERAFAEGYKAAMTFIEAIRNQKISQEVLQTGVPVGVLSVLHGPNSDFIVGRIWETVSKHVSDVVYCRADTKGCIIEQSEREHARRDAFQQRNCALLVR